jgi:hypothetical protein
MFRTFSIVHLGVETSNDPISREGRVRRGHGFRSFRLSSTNSVSWRVTHELWPNPWKGFGGKLCELSFVLHEENQAQGVYEVSTVKVSDSMPARCTMRRASSAFMCDTPCLANVCELPFLWPVFEIYAVETRLVMINMSYHVDLSK